MIEERAAMPRLLLITSVQKPSLTLYIYIQVRNATTFHSLDCLDKKNESQATMAQSVEHAIAARTFLGPSLGHFVFSGQNIDCASSERIGKNSRVL